MSLFANERSSVRIANEKDAAAFTEGVNCKNFS